MRLLAGDVGGTKTLLSIFEGEPGALREVRSERLESAAFADLEAMLRAFLGARPPSAAGLDAAGAGEAAFDAAAFDAAAFGVAGPVAGGRARITNLPWELDEGRLARALGVGRVTLLNDFEAVAWGIAALPPEALRVLQEGPVDPDGPVAILGAGTGLGEALIVPTPGGRRVLPTEGGHADFAPRDELEIGLLRFLLERHDRVSVERVISGPGLAAIYELVVSRRVAAESEDVRARMEREDPSAVIGELAVAGTDAACARAASVFLSLYGAEAGNLALKVLPTGGLFVAGGIAPRLLPLLERGPFLESFLRKGRMRRLLERIRVSVVLDPRVGLLGAREAAAASRA